MLVVGVALFLEEPPGSQGYGHGELSTMRQGGTGERHSQVLWLGVAFGVLQLLLFVGCLGFGLRGARGSSRAKRRALLLGGVLYLAVFMVLIFAYQDYLKDPTRLFLSLPLPTAVMLWVLWPFPLYFVFVYSMKFEDWVFRKEDSQRFRELVGSGPPGSSTQTGFRIAGGESLMDTGGGVTILVSVVAYMGICVVVGLWALRRTRSSADFFMAGRNLGVIVTGFAVFSSIMSGFGFVGGPGLVYHMGMSSLWMVISAPMGTCISFYLLGKRIRLLAELKESVSLPDVVAARYNSQLTRLLASLSILLGVMGYLGTQILAMATVLQDIIANTPIGRLSLEACVAVSFAVLVFYCVTGGIIASVYTDVVQGFIMVIAALLVFLAASTAVPDGFAGMSLTIGADDPEAIGPWGSVGMLGCLSWFFLFTLGSSGQPHVITKLMMSKRVEDVRRTLPISVVGYSLTALLWLSIGLAMRALVLSGSHPELPGIDAAAPQFLQAYTHPLLAGLVFAALFAAIMSTADGFLNIGSAAIVHDIPQSLRGRSLNNELLWARTATVAIALVASLFAVYSGDLVAILGAFGWGTFAAALVPVVTIGFNWKRATALAANTAMVSSLAINLGIKLLKIQIPFRIDAGAIALLVSLTLFFGISLLSKPPKLDPDVDRAMDL